MTDFYLTYGGRRRQVPMVTFLLAVLLIIAVIATLPFIILTLLTPWSLVKCFLLSYGLVTVAGILSLRVN